MTRTMVMAVKWDPQRAARACHLSEQVGAEIVWDTRRSALSTWRAMLRMAGDDPVICLQDDVRLCDDWRDKVEAVIAAHPDVLIQFFAQKLKVAGLRSSGYFIMAQCYYLPAGGARDLLDFARNFAPGRVAQDEIILFWLRATRQQFWLEAPSLVQHEPWTSVIDPTRSTGRRARFVDPSLAAKP